jgi:hypothetical protein
VSLKSKVVSLFASSREPKTKTADCHVTLHVISRQGILRTLAKMERRK